jgi:hypothetical protein
MSSIYTLMFRGSSFVVDRGRDPMLRLELAAHAIETIAATEEGATFALPAGFLHARTEKLRNEWAEQLLRVSRDFGVGLVFGIDDIVRYDRDGLGDKVRPWSFAYACDRGRKLLWTAAAVRDRAQALADRPVTVCGRRLVVLLQSEVFRRSARMAVEDARPELTLVLAYAGPTPRWKPSLMALEALAPTLIVHEELYRRETTWAQPPRGWRAELAATTSFVTIHRFAVEADGAQPSAMGD